MKFVSTRNRSLSATFHEATFQGFAPDGGLYIPNDFPTLPDHLLAYNQINTIPDLGQLILSPYITEIPTHDLYTIIKNALTFPIPLVMLFDHLYLLEVFHGPTLSFKDVGACFMANVLSYFLMQTNKKVAIMVATSGDTGSAIAHAFHHLKNIDVYILYPAKQITHLQEQQMTTLGDNIHALEVEGTFDDCQALVRKALLDDELGSHHILTTANSINISRLLPQMIYHSWGLIQLKQFGISENPVLSVPSGNFGNLVSAIYAKSLGFGIEHFIAATNINAVIPNFLNTAEFIPKPSKHSISNAMDVGNPSNFERLTAFYQNDMAKMRQEITGFSITDEETLHEIRQTYDQTGYILDPHTAVGVAAARKIKTDKPIIVTATAHPAKFPEALKLAIGKEAEMPERLKIALHQQKQSIKISPTLNDLKRVFK